VPSCRTSSRSLNTRIDPGERGWALVAVLWVLALLAMMAAAIVELQSTSARFEHRALDDLRLNSDIQAAMVRAVMGLTDTRTEARWKVDGSVERFLYHGDPVAVSVQDAAGLVDLNETDLTALQSLIQGFGVSSDDAQTLAQRIVDWRTQVDPDSPDVAMEARDGDYAQAGRNYRPRHAPFQSVDELKLVLGMSGRLYAQLAPLLTVYSRNSDVDLQVAPEAVRLALQSSTNEMGSQPGQGPTAVQPGLGATDSQDDSSTAAAVTPGHSYAITVVARHRDQAMKRTVTVAITGDDAKPVLVEAWR